MVGRRHHEAVNLYAVAVDELQRLRDNGRLGEEEVVVPAAQAGQLAIRKAIQLLQAHVVHRHAVHRAVLHIEAVNRAVLLQQLFHLTRAVNAPQVRRVILDIHGGPHLTYGAVYYHEMQYWANHGYYVICCNPRGGESRGNEFGYICGRFGTIDYDDIMAFCDEALKAYPDMDEKHMGVTGGSYGGFMTNWIIGHTNRFAAAASQRGIANFVSMEGTSDIGTLFAERQILATTHTNLEKMWKQSPLKYADRCTTPTLFIHSEEDYRCWMVEALQMYSTLIHHGVPTRLCLFHGENHELSRGGKPKGRIRRLQEITAWMDKYLKEE